MTIKHAIPIVLTSSIFCSLIHAQTIRYVKVGGAGTKNGSSWANARDDIQAIHIVYGLFQIYRYKCLSRGQVFHTYYTSR